AALLGREREQAEKRATDLEGARQLLRLELERDGSGRRLRQRGRLLDRRAADAALEGAARLEHHLHVERGHRRVLHCSPSPRWISARTRSASCDASAASEPAVSTGASTVTVAVVGAKTSECLGSAVSVPRIARGTTSTESSSARRNAPSRNGASEPSALRVPSGKTTTDAPSVSRWRMQSRASRA